MKVADAYNFAEEHGIKLVNIDLFGEKAISIMQNGVCVIAVDSLQIHSEKEELMAVTHETGHCETGSFYDENNLLDEYSRHEHRAIVWQIKKLIGKEKLEEAVKAGNTEMYEIAEYLDLPQDFVEKAVVYYKEQELSKY